MLCFQSNEMSLHCHEALLWVQEPVPAPRVSVKEERRDDLAICNVKEEPSEDPTPAPINAAMSSAQALDCCAHNEVCVPDGCSHAPEIPGNPIAPWREVQLLHVN
jgi:hypothetical protein